MHIAPEHRQPRSDDRLIEHREAIMAMRAEGHSFRVIAEKFGVSVVAVFKRWHVWNGTLGTSVKTSKRLHCPHCRRPLTQQHTRPDQVSPDQRVDGGKA